MYYITGDEHYHHKNIINYSNRPFSSIEEHDEQLVERHNFVVKPGDTVVHVGDFTLKNKDFASSIIKRLNGNHIFIQGSHDYWLKSAKQIWEKRIDDQYVVACHYAMVVWPRSHYGSWQLFGHSHGKLSESRLSGKQLDVGVDTNNFYPYSFDQIKKIMENKPDNFNLIRKENKR